MKRISIVEMVFIFRSEILAMLDGEDMTIYFGTLVHEIRLEWQQNLTKQALKVKPKISAVSEY